MELHTPAARGVNVDKLLPGYEYPVFEAAIIESVSLFPKLDRERR